MAKQVQWRRGTATQNNAFTGADGEVTVDSTNKSLRVHDGVTAGGFETARKTAVDAHIANTANPHSVTKTQVGLGNVDNTSDVNKPISTATQTALNGKATTAQGAKADTALQAGTSIDNIAESATHKKMTAAERTKLAGVATDATANATDATLLARVNHTGTQAISTVTGLQDDLNSKATATQITLVYEETPTGTGEAYVLNVDAVPANGQLFAFKPHTDSTITQPTVTITDGVLSYTTTLRPAAAAVFSRPLRSNEFYTFKFAFATSVLMAGGIADLSEAYTETAADVVAAEGRVVVVTAGQAGTGDAYTANASSIPLNGQYIDFQAPANSIGSTPTLALTFAGDTVTTSLRDSDGLPLTRPLKSGTRYLIRYGAASSRVVAGWGADQEDVITPIQPASSIAASVLASPTFAGTQTQAPIVINNGSVYTLQSFAQSVGVTATPAAPIVDLSLMIEGTSATIFSTAAQTWRLHSGATNFTGQSHNRATLTGEGHVIATRIGGRVCLTAGSGTLTYDTSALPAAKQSFLGAGQSNEVFMHQHGGIGGFLDGIAKSSWMTEGVILPSVYFIDGSTGGTSLLEASVPGTNWWYDDATDTQGAPLLSCLAAINAAVADGQPSPETITWTQGESDAAAMQAGFISVTQYKDALKEVWQIIRDRCISQGATDPQILVNEVGASDLTLRRVGTSRVRQATLEAIAETSYAFYAATNVDAPRVWGDVHYTSNAYHALGRRRARAWFNMCVEARGLGAWNPGTGVFPDAISGQWWTASAGGTVDGLTVTSGQTIMCFNDGAADTTTTSNVWRIFDVSDVYDLGPDVALTSTSVDGKSLTVTFTGTGVITPQGTKIGGASALLEGGAPGGFCVVKADRDMVRIASVTWDTTAKTATINCDEDATGATLHYLAGNMPEVRYGDFVRDGQVDTYTRIPGLPCRSGAFLIS